MLHACIELIAGGEYTIRGRLLRHIGQHFRAIAMTAPVFGQINHLDKTMAEEIGLDDAITGDSVLNHKYIQSPRAVAASIAPAGRYHARSGDRGLYPCGIVMFGNADCVHTL